MIKRHSKAVSQNPYSTHCGVLHVFRSLSLKILSKNNAVKDEELLPNYRVSVYIKQHAFFLKMTLFMSVYSEYFKVTNS